jgi:glycyl-tRNA synthetase
MPARSLDQIVSLSKRRGFVFPGSAAYGGLGSFWDYGPLGSELMRNVKEAWWKAMTWDRDDIEGVDCAILMNRKVWQHSGHEATFSDPLVDNKKTKKRYRLDHLLKAQKQDKLDALYDILRGAPTFMTPSLQEGLKPDPEVLAKSLVYHYQAVARHYATTPDQVRTENQAVLMDVFGLSADEAKQGSPGVGKPDPRMFDSDERNPLDAAQVIDPGTNESGEWTAPRNFNLMFQTHVGPVEAAPGTEEELASRVYLRPETAQGIFMNFKNVLESSRKKVPFGIAQIGKSFRNEITPGNFTFRTREFEQMEMEFFIKPPQFVKPGEKNDDQWHEEWVNTRYSWWVTYGIPTERLRKRAQDKSELAHYAKATTDIEYLFPGALGWGEVEGIANRTDYDLTAHSRDIPEADLKRLHLEPNKDSVTTLDYFDSEAKARYMPWVIEPAAGATRAALTFLCEAYHEEIVKQPPPAEIDALKVEIDAVIKNADKKKKDAEKEKDPAQRKHDPVAITAFQAALADAASRLPASLMEIDYMLEDHAGAQNLEPVKKLKPKVNKLAEDCVRVVLKLHPKLAPVKVAVFPLARNKPELVDIATRLTRELRHVCKTIYDDSGGIGKLYRRQDEIGTPLCITVDHQTLEDNMVTIRDRDTMQQVRVPLDKVVHDCRNKLGIH